MAVWSFLWMPAEFIPGDPGVWREEARSLLLAGELNVPSDLGKIGEPGQYFTRNERNGLYYSKYGIVNSFIALPPMWLDRALGSDIGRRGHNTSLLLANLWNIVLCVALASLLYRLSAPYSARVGVRLLYVLAALYCTHLWFYQRAQSSEIYQTLFFVALFMALPGFLRPLAENGPSGLDRRAWLCLAAVWLLAGLLLFVRVNYGLLFPLIVLLASYYAWQGSRRNEARGGFRTLAAALLLPPLVLVALLGAVNSVKFGAPWFTGYHQWRPEMHFPVGRLADGVWGYLFSPRFSVFFHFPLLAFAVLGARRFFERHRIDAVAMAVIFAAFFLWLAKTPTWAGEWAYGPRYLLPLLPVLSLPFLTFMDGVIDRGATWQARAGGAAVLAVLAFSAYLQVQMNRVPFFTYYDAREAMFASSSLEAVDYFLNRNTAFIARDLIEHRDDLDSLPFMSDMKRVASPQYVEEYRRNLGAALQRGNLYWARPR